MTAKRRRWWSSMDVVLELREERRRIGMGTGKVGRGPRPFVGGEGGGGTGDAMASVNAGP
jgi:hypothetical protein